MSNYLSTLGFDAVCAINMNTFNKRLDLAYSEGEVPSHIHGDNDLLGVDWTLDADISGISAITKAGEGRYLEIQLTVPSITLSSSEGTEGMVDATAYLTMKLSEIKSDVVPQSGDLYDLTLDLTDPFAISNCRVEGENDWDDAFVTWFNQFFSDTINQATEEPIVIATVNLYRVSEVAPKMVPRQMFYSVKHDSDPNKNLIAIQTMNSDEEPATHEIASALTAPDDEIVYLISDYALSGYSYYDNLYDFYDDAAARSDLSIEWADWLHDAYMGKASYGKEGEEGYFFPISIDGCQCFMKNGWWFSDEMSNLFGGSCDVYSGGSGSGSSSSYRYASIVSFEFDDVLPADVLDKLIVMNYKNGTYPSSKGVKEIISLKDISDDVLTNTFTPDFSVSKSELKSDDYYELPDSGEYQVRTKCRYIVPILECATWARFTVTDYKDIELKPAIRIKAPVTLT